MLDKKFIAISGIYGNAILYMASQNQSLLKIFSFEKQVLELWQKCASQLSSKYTVHNPSVDSRDLLGPSF